MCLILHPISSTSWSDTPSHEQYKLIKVGGTLAISGWEVRAIPPQHGHHVTPFNNVLQCQCCSWAARRAVSVFVFVSILDCCPDHLLLIGRVIVIFFYCYCHCWRAVSRACHCHFCYCYCCACPLFISIYLSLASRQAIRRDCLVASSSVSSPSLFVLYLSFCSPSLLYYSYWGGLFSSALPFQRASRGCFWRSDVGNTG